MRLTYAFPFLAICLASPNAFGRASKACFTPDEVKTMVIKRDAVSKGAADCLKNYWKTHNQFFSQNHYSKYYGNRSKTLDTADKRAKAILLVYWPNILPPAEMQKFIALYKMEGMKRFPAAKIDELNPGLSDLEKYIQVTNPALYNDYMSRKPSFNLDARAKEEVSQDAGKRCSDLRGNTTLPLQNISCVDMARRCLREGFKQAGMESTYEKVDNEVRATDLSGVEMQKALADLGWKILYFNPDTSQNAAWDADEKQVYPPTVEHKWQGAWGDHVFTWSGNCDKTGNLLAGKSKGGVLCSDQYMVGRETPVPVDDKTLLVNFQTTVPAAFKAVPFFIGTAHAGYHVFPGFSGNIIEAHSTRPLASHENLQVSAFNPLDQDHGGGPRWTNIEHYRSGVIAVPPGYLDAVGTLHTPQVDAQGCVDLRPNRIPAASAASNAPATPTGQGSAPSAPATKASTITF
ncbi:MAG: hypothetical protein ACXVCG_01985 [Bdellovibrionota bacterium]